MASTTSPRGTATSKVPVRLYSPGAEPEAKGAARQREDNEDEAESLLGAEGGGEGQREQALRPHKASWQIPPCFCHFPRPWVAGAVRLGLGLAGICEEPTRKFAFNRRMNAAY
jgi:hypothetical protein